MTNYAGDKMEIVQHDMHAEDVQSNFHNSDSNSDEECRIYWKGGVIEEKMRAFLWCIDGCNYDDTFAH